MNAVSLWQPFASAIACGAKKIETRAWATRYRGPLLIHASRTRVFATEDLRRRTSLWRSAFNQRDASFEEFIGALPYGALVARCELVDCIAVVDTESIRAAARRIGEKYSPLERQLGDYRRGRWAWMLAKVEPLPAPIPCRGMPGLFEVEEPAAAAAAAGTAGGN